MVCEETPDEGIGEGWKERDSDNLRDQGLRKGKKQRNRGLRTEVCEEALDEGVGDGWRGRDSDDPWDQGLRKGTIKEIGDLGMTCVRKPWTRASGRDGEGAPATILGTKDLGKEE